MTTEERTAVVCPFCALACDDLRVRVDEGRLVVDAHGCARAEAAFGTLGATDASPPRIAGEPASLEAALARAAELLAASRLPLFAGLGTDVAGMRGVLALADRRGGIVDHARAEGLMANLEAMRGTGWVTGTLAELLNRPSLVLLVGEGIDEVAPRLAERLLRPAVMLGPGEPATRRIVALGAGTSRVRQDLALPCPSVALPETLAILRALVAGRKVRGTPPVGAPSPEALAELAEALRAAPYAAIVWSLAGLASTKAAMVAWTLAELTKELNVRAGANRAIGLPLAGPGNLIGANQVTSWQTGLPLRTSFAAGVPDHAPTGHATARLLDEAAVDLCWWIDAFGDAPPPRTDVPVVELGPTPRLDTALVYLPVGTPGLDHGGAVYRSDGVVSLPVRALRDGRNPSVADTLTAIARLLPGAGDGQPGSPG